MEIDESSSLDEKSDMYTFEGTDYRHEPSTNDEDAVQKLIKGLIYTLNVTLTYSNR